MRWVAPVYLLFAAACGPVLLFGGEASERPPAHGPEADGGVSDAFAPGAHSMASGAGGASEAGHGGGAVAGAQPSQAGGPSARISVKPADCGRCFELTAEGLGGVPPYRFEWDDGSLGQLRRVCPEGRALEVSLIVEDASSARSTAYRTSLAPDEDAACGAPPAQLCMTNPSFEGTPAVNLGVPELFDAAPWSTCADPGAANTPDIGDETAAQTGIAAPKATEGKTFLALGPGEQVSQRLCESVVGGTELYMQFDAQRFDVGAGGSTDMHGFLEIWGGIAADCSRRQLLWASTAQLEVGWNSYCVRLKTTEFMDQITLRARGDAAQLPRAWVLVDNLVPVDACP